MYQAVISLPEFLQGVKAFVAEDPLHAGMIFDVAGKAAVFRQEKGVGLSISRRKRIRGGNNYVH